MKINELYPLHRFEMPKTGVYFLFKGEELVYIGRTERGLGRIIDHIQMKDFDSYSFKSCTYAESVKLEKELIGRYKPKLNKQFVKNELEKKQEWAKTILISLEKFKEEHAELLDL